MPDTTPPNQWVHGDLDPAERARFLVIHFIDTRLEEGLVARALPTKAVDEFRDASILVFALTGCLLKRRLFADDSIVCALPERDTSLLRDPYPLPSLLACLLPLVQLLVDAWKAAVT
jgi:hypothetical protein